MFTDSNQIRDLANAEVNGVECDVGGKRSMVVGGCRTEGAFNIVRRNRKYNRFTSSKTGNSYVNWQPSINAKRSSKS